MVTFRDPFYSPEGALVDAIVETDRMISILTAAKQRLVAAAHSAVTGLGSHALAEREFRAEIATALRISERGAAILIDEADVLVEHLPATHAALADGRLTPAQAHVLVDVLALLDPDDRAALERDALAAADRSTAAFRRFVTRLRETRDAATAVERHRAAFDDRHVTLTPGRDGMGWFDSHLSAVDCVAIDSRLDDLARGLLREGDPRTMAQLRADALVDVLLDRDSRALRRFPDAKPTVIVTVPISVLAGGDGQGDLVGYGPIDAETARELAAEAPVLRRMFTDPRDDRMLGLGRTRYRVSDDLRLFLTVRDARCRFPNCARRATATDVDHSIDWAHGGSTDVDNLAHLCRGHHTVKHETRWRLEATHPDGTVDWVSPTGRRYRTRPDRAAAAERATGSDPPQRDPVAASSDRP